jgi:ATP-dependent DNA helicase RecG
MIYTAIITGKSGTYTRRKGLDKETNKELLLKHIKRNKAEGRPLRDLQEVLPNHSRQQIQRLLAELKREEMAFSKGKTRRARWYPTAPEPKEGQP